MYKVLIGILSDIHGNSVALEKVLKEAKNLKVDHLLILGDQIGYYYDCIGVFDLLNDWSKNVIRGNHEEMFLGLLDHTVDPNFVKRRYGSSLEIATRILPNQRVDEIKNYSSVDKFTFRDVNVTIGHGTPWSTNEYVYPDASIELLQKCEVVEMDFVFLGHTHYPFVYRGANCLVINPGSVGQSRVRGGIAEWGILNTVNKVYTAKQTSFDTSPIRENVERNDPDVPYLRDILLRGAH